MGVNVQASVEAQIFGANVVGMVDRHVEGDTTTTQFLVMPSELNENKPFGIADIVKEINDTIYKIENDTDTVGSVKNEPITVDQIKNALSVVGLDKAEFTFMQTFIYYKGKKNKATTNTETEHMEYAIGIHIETQNIHSDDFQFLKINEAYINVWDTERQNILERMKIWTLDQLKAK